MNYKGYYSDPKKRLKDTLLVALVILPPLVLFYLISENWELIKDWVLSLF